MLQEAIHSGKTDQETDASDLALLGVPAAAVGWLLRAPSRALKALYGRSRSEAIKAHCVECCGGSAQEPKHCPADDCPLWQYRPGASNGTSNGAPKWASSSVKGLLREILDRGKYPLSGA